MHVFGRGGRSNQIAVTARSCNEKHENNLGKTFANTLVYDDQKLLVERIMIWFSGKTGRCHSEVGVQVPTITSFFLSIISLEIRCEFRIEHFKMLI